MYYSIVFRIDFYELIINFFININKYKTTFENYFYFDFMYSKFIIIIKYVVSNIVLLSIQ
jgi:hypothetical protein